MFYKDLIGMTFNRLVPFAVDNERSNPRTKFLMCKCKCGNIVSVSVNHLRSGHTQSCGCLQRDKTSEFNTLTKTKSNRIEFDSNLGCLRVYFNNCDEYFLCDIEDRDIAEKYCWRKNNSNYSATSIIIDNIKYNLLFHRLVMEKQYGDLTGYVIDHINHNTLDNRKYNLRKCTFEQNSLNSRPTSTTGEKYIYFSKSCNRYIFQTPSKENSSVYFNTLEEAISFRDNYLKEHPNDFYYNPDEDYINRNNPNAIHPLIFMEK